MTRRAVGLSYVSSNIFRDDLKFSLFSLTTLSKNMERKLNKESLTPQSMTT